MVPQAMELQGGPHRFLSTQIRAGTPLGSGRPLAVAGVLAVQALGSGRGGCGRKCGRRKGALGQEPRFRFHGLVRFQKYLGR